MQNIILQTKSGKLYLTLIVTKSCGGKFGAPSRPFEPNTLKINAESDKVPSPLSPLKIWIDLYAFALKEAQNPSGHRFLAVNQYQRETNYS
jgi:hypothetical protein